MGGLTKILVLCLVLTGTVAVGFGWRDISQGKMPKFDRLSTAIVGKPPKAEALTPTRTFGEALANIDAAYHGKPVRKQLLYAGVAGMLAALKDPHTMLLEPDMARQFQEKSHGEFVGIGAELARDVMGAKIRRVFKGSPAKAVGLLANDIITKVDGRDVAGLDIQEIVKHIRGDEGTKVALSIYRAQTKEAKVFRVSRRTVQIQDVYGEIMRGDGIPATSKIGRLEVRSFSETIVSQFDQELADLEAQNIQGLIIDLRGNPGGLLSAAVDMSSRFLDGKIITSMKKRDGKPEVFVARSGMIDTRQYPIVILIDENSASAAEIFAGAMHDWHAATLVGEHSYGKGSVQIVRPLPDGAQLKMTIARYYLPSGDSVQRVEDENGQYVSGGIKPDVESKPDPRLIVGDLNTDNQLRKAIEVMLGKLR